MPHKLEHNQVIAKAPLRIGLTGGGSDIEAFFSESGYGACLTASISRYATVRLSPSLTGEFSIRVGGLHKTFGSLDEATWSRDSSLIANALKFARERYGAPEGPLEVVGFVDAPIGSGLGSSSSLIVALMAALATLAGQERSQIELAEDAYFVERVMEGLEGGWQDQMAASHGGVNLFEFKPTEKLIHPVANQSALKAIESMITLVDLGTTRSSSKIIQHQIKQGQDSNSRAFENLKKLAEAATDARHLIEDFRFEEFSKLINESWSLKKATSKLVSDSDIDHLVERLFSKGAVSAKISGAGGGGHLLVLSNLENKLSLWGELRYLGLAHSSVNFEEGGVQAFARQLKAK